MKQSPRTSLRPWEDDFFEPELLDAGAGDADIRETVHFYRSAVGDDVTRVLDIGCGTGRLSLPLAGDGHEVHAIDRSPRVLTFFRNKLKRAERGVRRQVKLSRLDIALRPYPERLDAALAVDDFLTLFLDEASLRAVLAHVRQSLSRGGRFCTDMRARSDDRLSTIAAPLPRPMLFFGIVQGVATPRGARSVAMRSIETYDESARVLTSEQLFEYIKPTGLVERSIYRTLRQRVWHPGEIAAAAEAEGFRVAALHARFDPRAQAGVASGASFDLRVR
ncbi:MULTISPECIES: class I SAM-dependent methyltransferase [Sorangium]|uniref:Methyltransferase domain-containing protein n=1 Tax=Sorangium cellulosum TaxID=56 RepID=A0A4P2QUW4_SORCE|nr:MULTISPECIES: class I SAM-dependent methyltransferase [Sorangium]AUX34190.1 uncharacterized protein SOCE836_063590 [Sorangium cellulosum]WCQ93503.1 tRNA methyltransferase [Sorangium sp. Soce836]